MTYYWPPAGGPGVQRILKFVKYLPQFGWSPIVLTAHDGDYVARDETLIADVPEELQVHTVEAREFYDVYRKVTGKKKGETIPVGAFVKGDTDSFMERLAKWVRINLLVPDARFGWIRPFASEARKLIEANEIDAILSTSPPQSIQVAAWRIRRHSDIPWVADFRDPWTEIIFYQNLKRNRLTSCFDRYLERQALQNADGIITVSRNIAERFQERYESIHCEIIPNGYDRSDMIFDATAARHDKFRIGWIGNLKALQNPENLWQALADLVGEDNKFRDDLQLYFTGKVDVDAVGHIERLDLQAQTVYEASTLR